MSSRPDPRVLHTRRAVQAAVTAELAAEGYGGMTMEGIAARAGVAKSTLYRHWPDKLTVLADTLASGNDRSMTTPADGSVRQRIEAVLTHLVDAMEDREESAALPALIQAAEHHPAVAAHHHAANDARRDQLVQLLQLGIDTGALRPDLDAPLAALALCGPIFYRRLMTAEPFPHDLVPRLIDQVLGPAPRS